MSDSPERIIVVDDDDDFRSLMQQLLEDEGWVVLPCRDMHSALDALREARPDLVITDLRLQDGKCGMDMLHFMDLHPTLHDIPAILCTGSPPDVQEQADWLKQRRVAVLGKPFDIDDLYATVRHTLEWAPARVHTAAG